MTVPAFHPHGDVAANLAAFGALLREQHGFTIGPGEVLDALRALEHVGVGDRERVRGALKLVLCASREQADAFDAAFELFFLPEVRQGVAQRNLAPRHTLPQPPTNPDRRGSERQAAAPPRPTADHGAEDDDDETESAQRKRVPVEDDGSPAEQRGIAAARYSAAAGDSGAAEVPHQDLEVMLHAAGILVRRLRLGRSRAWRAAPAGARFDFRRTMRGALQTGGEPLRPRWLGHPPRNPRIVVVVDGSRSMSDHAGLMLQFAYALSRRTRRLDAFVFSTELRDVTRRLQRFMRGEPLRFTDLSEAWGGGTRIGACLETLTRDFGHRCLTEQTLVLILSDGLDVGEVDRLRAALRELRRRCAGLIWLNPLLETPGYVPEAQGMQAALPYLEGFFPAGSCESFVALARAMTL